MIPDATTRLNAALEGRYRIERELGEGGMATVYLADDLKHERKVALKVLKPELAAVVGAERFLAEIKTTANLQHPHILPLFDSGEADSFLFYVMPYVEGESLREKLDREKQLGVDDALSLAAKLCDALDYAHSEGVIHRDIKPANILLSKRGEPLVADFGIALAVAHAGGGRITETGLSLGTPHYMSPEQATGDAEVNPRSDVYALACVVYEMLAGEPPFTATTAQAILAKILTMDAPSITMVRRTVPSNVSAAVARALEKLPADRFPTVSDFAAALADPGFVYAARAREASHGGALDPAMVGTTGGSSRAASWIRDARSVAALGALAGMSLIVLFGWLGRSGNAGAPAPLRAEITGALQDIRSVAISPDGRWIAAASRLEGTTDQRLFVRAADAVEWRLLEEILSTTGDVAFSPDGEWIAYTGFSTLEGTGNYIFRVPVTGGPPIPLGVRGQVSQWTEAGSIVYEAMGEILTIGEAGGEPERIFHSDNLRARWPHLLPDGDAVLFSAEDEALMVAEVTTGAVRRVGSLSGMRPAYVPTGHLVYAHRDGILMSVGFDTEALEATSAPVAILPGIYARVIGYGSARFWSAAFDVSSTGALVYGMGVPETPAPLSWLDMEGRETPVPTALPSARSPKISPDGTRIAFEALDDHIWIHDVRQGTDMQLTFEGRSESPVWSPDGRFVYFLSERPGTEGLDGFRKPADGGSDAEQLWSASGEVAITSVSPDGGTLVLATQRGPSGPESRDISLFRLDGSGVGEFVEYLASDGEESEGTVSPNGRWLAYFGTGADVFIRGFPDPVGLWRVSEDGEMRRSYDPVWAPDGSALYYGDAGALSKVEVQADGPFTLGARTRLFNWTADPGGPGKAGFDIHPDGDRFVVAETGFFSGASALYVFTDLFGELKRLVPN